MADIVTEQLNQINEILISSGIPEEFTTCKYFNSRILYIHTKYFFHRMALREDQGEAIRFYLLVCVEVVKLV